MSFSASLIWPGHTFGWIMEKPDLSSQSQSSSHTCNSISWDMESKGDIYVFSLHHGLRVLTRMWVLDGWVTPNRVFGTFHPVLPSNGNQKDHPPILRVNFWKCFSQNCLLSCPLLCAALFYSGVLLRVWQDLPFLWNAGGWALGLAWDYPYDVCV